MFDVGFSELVLLFVIGLLILGPERLPRVATQLGRWMGKARRTAHQLRMQLEREMTMNDIMRDRKEREQQTAEAAAATDASAEKSSDQHEEDANDSGHRDAGADEAGVATQPVSSHDEPSTATASDDAGQRRA
ncbi:MAG: Sec-independent protein translocase protein TatB [Gammaproteobacteria bacterium]|jgi:sec-independent protein translocase protein TatB